MSKLNDYQFSLPSCARRAFSDAAISLSIFYNIPYADKEAAKYYYKRFEFSRDFAMYECGLTDEEKAKFDFYVREYARELNG